MCEVPENKPEGPPGDEYARGYHDGWLQGHKDGKSLGYVDAKTRSRLAIEAACDTRGVDGSTRTALMRASDNILGKVE